MRFSTKQANAEMARGEIAGKKVILAKPQTFMNLSGQAVRGLANYYKIPTDRILLIYDEIALPVGTIRIREKGSSAGHNGVNSVIQQMGTQNIARIRVGVDRPTDPRHSQIDWVLGRFMKEEQPLMEETIRRAAEAAESILRIGMERAMNIYNTGPGETRDEGRPSKESIRNPQSAIRNSGVGAENPANLLETTPRTNKNDLSMETLRQRIDRIMNRKEEGK
jgi:PTH1 family peptidyl-tRNA hydrolase